MADIVSLAAYRSGLRISGTTLCWRDLRHTLQSHQLMAFCEALYEASTSGGTHAAAGFVIKADRRCLTVVGWDMGPMVVVRGREAVEIGEKLMAAEIARIKAGKGVSA